MSLFCNIIFTIFEGTPPSSLVCNNVRGTIVKILPNEGLAVELEEGSYYGVVDMVDISDYFIANPLTYFNNGEKYK